MYISIGGFTIFNNFQGEQGQKCPVMGNRYAHHSGILITAWLDNWGPLNDSDKARKDLDHIIQEKQDKI